MPHRGLAHVEQAKGFAAFTYNVVDGRPSCVRAAAGATRKGLSVSDGNKRVCPTNQVAGTRKRPALERDSAQGSDGPVISARPQHTPETMVRRGASAPALVGRAAAEEPIDLTNTSSGSDDGPGSRGDSSSVIARLRAQLLEAQRGKQFKQELVDDAALEVQKLMKTVRELQVSEAALKESEVALKQQLAQQQDESAAMISDLKRRLADAAGSQAGGETCAPGSVAGTNVLQTYIQHVADRLAEVINITVPSDGSLATTEGTVACAERLAVDLAHLIAEQRAKADTAEREATEERKAREQLDAALVRAGQAAQAAASAQLSTQVSHLEAEKNRQIWELQLAMETMKGAVALRIASSYLWLFQV